MSWSPADMFEKFYQPTTGMNFQAALTAMQAGHKVSRSSVLYKEEYLFWDVEKNCIGKSYIDVNKPEGYTIVFYDLSNLYKLFNDNLDDYFEHDINFAANDYYICV